MTIWLAVTPDRYELPITFGDNCKELAMMMRVPLSSIYQMRTKEKNGAIIGGAYRVRLVEVQDDVIEMLEKVGVEG